jgi:hypothetical protein
VPRDAVAIEWGYEADHDFDRRCRRLSEAGLTFLVAPGTSAWNSTGGRFETARSNIASAVRAAETYGAAGMLLTDWGDNGHIPPPLVSYPAIALAAALAWQGTGAHASPDVFSWLRAFVLRDEDGHLADSLRLLNTLDIHEPREVPNASILGVVLLTVDKAAHVGLPERTAPDTIRLMEDQAHRARSILAAAQAVDHEGELQKAELVFCADLALFAVDVLRRYAHAPEEQQGAPPAHRHLRQRLEHLKARLAALWVRRSRRGGLEHSLSILELGLKHVESLRSDQ